MLGDRRRPRRAAPRCRRSPSGGPGARGHHRLELVAAQDRVGRVGGRDHDVGAAQLRRRAGRSRRRGRRRGRPARGRCRRCGWRPRPRGRRAASAPARSPRPCGRRRSAAPAGRAGRRGRPRPGRAPRRAPTPSRCRCASASAPLAHLERLAEEAVEDRPGGALLGARAPRRAHLALDLALADDHRVEAGGHPEELGRRAVVAQHVAGAGELVGRDAGVGDDRLGQRVLGERRRRARRRRSRCGCR